MRFQKTFYGISTVIKQIKYHKHSIEMSVGLPALEFVILTTANAANDKNSVNTTPFLFQWIGQQSLYFSGC